MDKIEGLFAVMLDLPWKTPEVVGIGTYEQAVNEYHQQVLYNDSQLNPDYKVRLIKITFLD